MLWQLAWWIWKPIYQVFLPCSLSVDIQLRIRTLLRFVSNSVVAFSPSLHLPIMYRRFHFGSNFLQPLLRYTQKLALHTKISVLWFRAARQLAASIAYLRKGSFKRSCINSLVVLKARNKYLLFAKAKRFRNLSKSTGRSMVGEQFWLIYHFT